MFERGTDYHCVITPYTRRVQSTEVFSRLPHLLKGVIERLKLGLNRPTSETLKRRQSFVPLASQSYYVRLAGEDAKRSRK
jgi:hypothetical protein